MISYNQFIQLLKKAFLNLSLKFKIIFVFISFLVIYILIGSASSLYVMNSQKINQLHEGALQSIDIMKSNIESNIDSINNVSKIIILDPYVRQYLKNPTNNTAYRSMLYHKFTQLYVIFPFIESIFIYDFDNNNINASREVVFSSIEKVQDAPWFQEVMDAKGKYVININAGGTLLSTSGNNTVSMIRILYDIEDITPIGILIINTSQDFFSFNTIDTQSKYGTSFVLLDESENIITKNNHQNNSPLVGSVSDYTVGKIQKFDAHKYFVLSSEIPKYNWSIVSYTPINVFSQTTDAFSLLLIILIICSIIVFIVSSFFTAKVVTTPIKKLIHSMVGTRKGVFETVNIPTGNDEIGELKDTYNIMVVEIKKMINNEIESEKQKRRFELNILNEQINPHFLYNTLDSIGYLALSNNNLEAYQAILSLGQFYKISLNKGNEILLFEEEIKMTQEYLSLQKLRYGDIIHDQYNLSPETLKVPILKNTLQPLVENCINHGIKPSGERGTIIISSIIKNNLLYVTVKDDGLGMSSDQITCITSDYLDENTASFGLRGTIARLKLYYGATNLYAIKSKPFEGTSITLKIPIQGGHNE